jgi:imidazolonepropionase-like amidohydrolase
MKKNLHFYLLISLIAVSGKTPAQIAIKAETIYTVTQGTLQHGVILIRNKTIEAIGKDLKIPEGYTIYEARAVTPGLVDARSVVGLSGPLNIAADQDQIEKSAPIQPELRALDAYNPDDKLVEYLRNNGVTTLHTGHGIGALVSGQTMVVKTKPGFIDQVTVLPVCMLAMTLGPSVRSYYSSPGTKAKEISLLRTELLKAQSYLKKQSSKDSTKKPELDPNMEMLGKLLKKEVKGLISANRATDIMSAIRLAREFGFKLVLEGVAEGYRMTDEIKQSGAEVIVHATMTGAEGDRANLTMENAALLTKAGIPVSIESGYEGYVPKTRVILFEAAAAVGRGGMPFDEAMKAITIHPAKLLGLDKQIGSLEKGKDADLVLYNGDPFEYVTRVCKVFIDGRLVADNCQ